MAAACAEHHFADDALHPHAVDKPFKSGVARQPKAVQDEACGDEFACAVLAPESPSGPLLP